MLDLTCPSREQLKDKAILPANFVLMDLILWDVVISAAVVGRCCRGCASNETQGSGSSPLQLVPQIRLATTGGLQFSGQILHFSFSGF